MKATIDPKLRRHRLTERLENLRERVLTLEMELSEYDNRFFRVCIFGSARLKPEDKNYILTEQLGHLLGMRGIDVLTGGGPGLMEAANKGVVKGKKNSGSKSRSYGIAIQLNQFEPLNEHLDVKHHHKRFSSRLDEFMRLSHAVVVMPGGIGTLLELFFAWQLIQVGHIQVRPLILIGKGFWSGLISWIHEQLLGHGLISPGDVHWVHIVDKPDEAVEIIDREFQKFVAARDAKTLLEKQTE